MMAGFLVGTITGVYASGFLAVKVPGSPRPVRVSAGRQLSSAVLGEQVLVAVEGSRMWATVLLGTGPVAAQSDVDPVVTAPPHRPDQPTCTKLGSTRLMSVCGDSPIVLSAASIRFDQGSAL